MAAIQGIKKGIMEMADLIVVTKADGDLLPAARRAHLEYTSALKFMQPKTTFWRPKVRYRPTPCLGTAFGTDQGTRERAPQVLSVSALALEGMQTITDTIRAFYDAARVRSPRAINTLSVVAGTEPGRCARVTAAQLDRAVAGRAAAHVDVAHRHRRHHVRVRPVPRANPMRANPHARQRPRHRARQHPLTVRANAPVTVRANAPCAPSHRARQPAVQAGGRGVGAGRQNDAGRPSRASLRRPHHPRRRRRHHRAQIPPPLEPSTTTVFLHTVVHTSSHHAKNASRSPQPRQCCPAVWIRAAVHVCADAGSVGATFKPHRTHMRTPAAVSSRASVATQRAAPAHRTPHLGQRESGAGSPPPPEETYRSGGWLCTC